MKQKLVTIPINPPKKIRITGDGFKKNAKRKPPIIRKGTTRAYVQPTDLEIQQRIDTAYVLLAKRVTRSQVHAIFEKQFHVTFRTADAYLRRAKMRMLEEAGKSRQEQRSDSLNTYLAVIRDLNARHGDIISAQRCVDDLLGLKEPTIHRVTDGEGKPIAPTVIAPSVTFIIRDNGRDHAQAIDSLETRLVTAGNGGNGSGNGSGNGEAG